MRNIILLIVSLSFPVAVSAAEDCKFISANGFTAEFDDPMTITVTAPDGKTDRCQTFGGGPGVAVRGANCESGFEGPVFFGASRMGGDQDLLVFQNDIWYAVCMAK